MTDDNRIILKHPEGWAIVVDGPKPIANIRPMPTKFENLQVMSEPSSGGVLTQKQSSDAAPSDDAPPSPNDSESQE